MIHVAPLPGSPGYGGDPELPVRRAVADAEALAEAGFAAVVVENYGDLPFYGNQVPKVTVASLARVAAAVRASRPELRVAINCLRNDAEAAMSIACATQAHAIRVNVHAGAALTDQGLLEGRAAETLRLRRSLGADVRILADIRVKHSSPAGERPLGVEASDLRYRARADALLVTGHGTGRPASPDDVAILREAVPDSPLLVASGVTHQSARDWAELVDGAIVGSALMHDGEAGRGVDSGRAQSLLRAWTSRT
jgi:membrane complex biogenesis BtpA family protein